MAHHCPSASKAPHPCLSLSRCRPPPHGGTDLGYVSINFQQICKLSAFCTVSVSRLFPLNGKEGKELEHGKDFPKFRRRPEVGLPHTHGETQCEAGFADGRDRCIVVLAGGFAWA